jgi:hypothetical protein
MRLHGKVAVTIGKRIGEVRAQNRAAIIPARQDSVVGPHWFLQ